VSGVVVVTTLIKFSGSVAIFAVWSGGLNTCMLWRCVTEVQLKLEITCCCFSKFCCVSKNFFVVFQKIFKNLFFANNVTASTP